MNTHTPNQPPKPAGTIVRDAQHYRHLLARTKWFILLTIPTVLFAALAFVFLIVRPENPELIARALIGLERTNDASGAPEGVRANLGREDIMMSRTFLKDVARTLSLQVQTAPLTRGEVFDSISIDSRARLGRYSVRDNPQTPDEFIICYYDTSVIELPILGVWPASEFDIIGSGKWASDTLLQMDGLTLKFSRSLRARPRAFTFHVVDIRVAVEAVYRNLAIKRADPDKSINYIAVTMASRDYALAAATANAIADAFIDKNSSFRQSRTTGVVESLEKQLQLSQANLFAAESKVREFRSANPQVGLNQQAQQTVNSLAQLDNGIQRTASDRVIAAQLKKAFLAADMSHRPQIASEIAELLSSHSLPSGRTLQEELTRLIAVQNQQNAIYGSEHPKVLENNRAITNTVGAIAASLNDFIDNAQSSISNKRQRANQLSSRLQKLPALEMQLGELQRNQQIFSDIYSAVLSSYNKAKVADAVETADFYVMDYAVAPLPPPADQSRLVIMCIFIALLAGFAPVLISDLFDKSVRSQRQLHNITGGIVLEAIPFFSLANEKGGVLKSESRPLISEACIPNYTREIFDSLLVKIKLRMFESTDRCVVVSSFEDSCGKSTISANLAVAMALRGHHTLLVDSDLRRGMVKEIFDLPESGGLAALLAQPKPLTDDECMRSIIATKIPDLYVLPCGHEPANPGALLSSRRMEEFRQFCAKQALYTIIDTPPLGIVSDAVVFQKFFSHYLFVVRSGKTNVTELINRINEFDELPDKILGYVLNDASHEAVGTYRRYSKYYSHSDQSTGKSPKGHSLDKAQRPGRSKPQTAITIR